MEEVKLSQIKQEKLTRMVNSGVPEKYTAELTKKKCLVSSIH